MQCPQCASERTRVIDTRTYTAAVRRVRECTECGHFFRTWEEVETRQAPLARTEPD